MGIDFAGERIGLGQLSRLEEARAAWQSNALLLFSVNGLLCKDHDTSDRSG
jgi:hypothetical protein